MALYSNGQPFIARNMRADWERARGGTPLESIAHWTKEET